MEGLPARKSQWVLTQEAFDQLLIALDTDRERAAEKYEQVRLKLVKFFEWRGSGAPEEQADETINRVARKVVEGEVIRNLGSYFLGVARLLLLEAYKERKHERAALDRLPPPVHAREEDDRTEPRRECFEQCLQSLPRESHELIVEYYRPEKQAKIDQRKRLAESRGIPLNALRIRAHRIRARLEECMHECIEGRVSSGK